MMIRVVLADDHALVRQGVRALIESDGALSVVGEAEDGDAALETIETCHPDVVVMDLAMPTMDGVAATRKLLARWPELRIVMLSAACSAETTSQALHAGAVAYVPKTAAFQELSAAIHAVANNRVYLSPTVAGHVVDDYCRGNGKSASPIDVLSAREREVLHLIASGRSTKEIARDLHISVKTAESHRRNLMAKLDIDNVAELTKLAIREQLTTL
jgi:two-component system, NarL family, response regulator NreC